MAKTKTEIIRSVRVGDRLDLVLSEVNAQAYRVRASEINRKEGYQHYRIASNRLMNQLSIMALPKDGN